MSYISVVFLAASSQSLPQLWSLSKRNFPWKPTRGVCFGIVLLLRGASLSSFKQVEKETKDELRSKEHKGRMQSSPRLMTSRRICDEAFIERRLWNLNNCTCAVIQKKEKTCFPKCNFGKVYRRTLARSAVTHTDSFCGYSHRFKHVPTPRVAKWRQHLATWKVFFRLENIHL